MKRTIIVTIDGGDTVVETKGFAGAECLKATAELERALGLVTRDEKTAEYRAVARTAAQERTRG